MLVAALITVLSCNSGIPDIPITGVIPARRTGHGQPRPRLLVARLDCPACVGGRDDRLRPDPMHPATAYPSAKGCPVGRGMGVGALPIPGWKPWTRAATWCAPSSLRESGDRDGWGGLALRTGSGLQRLWWDLRTDAVAAFPGMSLWGVRRDGGCGGAGEVHGASGGGGRHHGERSGGGGAAPGGAPN